MSRLEEIKESKYFFTVIKDSDLYKDWNWLIEQSERAKELEEDYKVRQVEYLEEHIDRLEQQNKRYREARKRVEARYDKEYDIQSNEYMGGIADGLKVAMWIIDRTLEREQ